MKIVSAGGGPAGLFFAILMKQLDPRHEITVLERNRPGDAFGWGVVFSDDTLAHFAAADSEVHRAITERFVYWNEMDVYVHGQKLRTAGHGFCGIARKSLLEVLQQRAARLGVHLVFEREVRGRADAGDADLVIAADGVNSRLREEAAARFAPAISWGRCRFSWLGTSLPLDAFTFVFKESEHGLFQAHAYPFQQGLSTFIVECHEKVWKRAGLETASEAETVRYLENLFRDDLKGHPLLTNNSVWRAFPVVSNDAWTSGHVVLMGDAAHTAHFSIGSGTKLAMEDAVSLAGAFREAGGRDVAATLAAYEAERRPVVARFQSAARTSQEWFENSARHLALDPVRFTFSLLTRSKRVTYETLRERDPELVAAAAASFAGPGAVPAPPLPAPVLARRAAAAQQGSRVTHVPVLERRRHAQRLAPRAPGQPRAGRRRAGHHRGDPCRRRRPHLTRLCGDVFSEACAGVAARCRVRARIERRPHRHAVEPRRAQGRDRRSVARRHAAAGKCLATAGAVAPCVRCRLAGAARHDPR